MFRSDPPFVAVSRFDVFSGRMNVSSSFSQISWVDFFSTFVLGNFLACILRPPTPTLIYMSDLAFLSATSHGLSPHSTPILSI